MADSLRITCIINSDRYNDYERIFSIGGRNADGTHWRLSQQDAIKGIEEGKWQFHVTGSDGKNVRVVVAKSQYGHNYLKSEADGEQPESLLALPECPKP